MTLTIPPEIPRPVVELVAGPWPEFDEDAGRRRADMFKQLGDAVLAAGNLTGPAGALAVAAIRGQTGETLRGHSADLDGGVRGIANKCYSLEAQCRQGSLQAEFTKYVTIASLAALVLQLGVAAVTPGIGTVAGAAEAAGTRLTIRAAYRALIEALERDALRAAEERAIEKGAALGAGTRLGRTILENGAVLGFIQGGGIPLGAQIVQVAQGHRDGITWSDVGMGAVSGFAGGGLGQFVGGRVMNRLAQRIGAGGFARRGAVQLAGAAAGGVSGLAPGVLVQKAYTGQWDLMPYGLLGGVAGALPHGFRGPPGGPESIGNGHMNTGAGGGARPRTVGAKPRIATSESSTRKTVFADPDATRADGTGRRRWPFRGSSGKLGRSSAVEPHDQQNAPVNKQPGRNRAVEGVPEEPRPENGHGSPPNRLEEEQHDHPEHGDQQGQDQQGQEVPEPPAVDPVATDIADPHAVMDFYHRLHDAAANAGGDSSWQIQQYSMQKALARIFDHSPDSWELKGGQALLAQIDGARPSNDIDLTATSRREVPDMVADYRAAVERPLVGDSLRFVYDHEVPLRRAEGTTVFHRVYIGDMEVMQLSTDLTAPREHPNWAEQFGLDATEEVPLPAGILPGGPRPNLRIISNYQTMANKFAGMFTSKGSRLPERPQDLMNAMLIARSMPFDGAKLQAIVRSELRWRIEHGETINVPDELKVPNPDWVPWFDRFLRLTDGLPYRSLDEMLPAAHEFFDPILSGTDLRAHWDHEQMRWIHEDEAPTRRSSAANGHPPAGVAVRGTETNVLRLEGTGAVERSTVEIDPQNKAPIWDGLTSRGAMPQRVVDFFNRSVGDGPRITSLNEFLDRLAYHGRSPADSVDRLHEFVTDVCGYGVETTTPTGPESGHLRLYAHQSGRLPIFASALMLDPNTTIEIAYQPNKTIEDYAEEAAGAHIRYIGEIPEGITPDQAHAVAFDRWAAAKKSGTGVPQEDLSIHDLPEQILMRGILKLQADPLEAALNMRRRLIDEYGLDPGRIRLTHGEMGCEQAYPSSERRAHIITLGHFREDTVGSREKIVNAMLGTGQDARDRAILVESVANEVLGFHEPLGSDPKKYTILWVRESRPFSTHMPELDTRPEQLRQIIEMLKERQPDRTIMLAGDDLFKGRDELLYLWRREGVLTGVDRRSLVGFWEDQNLTRAEQALVFHRIGTQRDVVQIGMENGVLGPQALLGIPTVYLSSQEYPGARGDLLELLFTPWQFGHTSAVLDESGRRTYNRLTGLAQMEFRPSGPELKAPVSTIGRVHVGPDLPHTLKPPADLYGDRQAKVNRVSSQIAAQMDSGEMDSWRYRLGLVWPDPADPEPVPWSAHDWKTSRWYAHQLSRWLHTEATTPEQVADKWDGIRLALKGVLSPRFTIDETYRGASVVHPYFGRFSQQPVPDEITRLIAEAYGAGPGSRSEFDPRPVAVTDALKQLLVVTDIKTQAVRDLAAFRMPPGKLAELHRQLDHVIADNRLHQAEEDEKGYTAPPGLTAWDAVGAATHSGRPAAASMHVPESIVTHILEGDELGGGHRFGRGLPDKSEFPQRWTDSDVVRYVLEVAAEPDWVHFQRNGRWKVRGERDGVEMSVIIDPRGQVWSAWPRSGDGVFRNPPEDP